MNKLPREYVLIPKDEYEALTKPRKAGRVDAIAYARASLARDLLADGSGPSPRRAARLLGFFRMHVLQMDAFPTTKPEAADESARASR